MAQSWLSRAVPVEEPSWLKDAIPVDGGDPEAAAPDWLQNAVPVEEEAVAKPASGDIQDTELQDLARKHNVDPEALRELAPYFGATLVPSSLPDSLAQGGRAVAGTVGRTLGFGLPQFLYKKSQDSSMRAALDDLTARGESQRGLISQVAEGVVGPTTVLKKGAGAAARLAEAVGSGALLGTTSSREGEELKAAGTGALIGGGLGAAGELIGVLSRRTGKKPGGVEKEALQSVAPDIEDGTAAVLARRQDTEQILEQAIVPGSKPAPLDDATAKRIVDEYLDPDLVAAKLDPLTVAGQLYQESLIKHQGRKYKLTNRLKNIDEAREMVQLNQIPGERKALNKSERATQESLQALKEPAAPASKEQVLREMASDVVETRVRDFAEFLGAGKRPKDLETAQASISSWASRQGGEEALRKQWQLFQSEQAALQHIQEAGVRGGQRDHFGNRLGAHISDAQFVLRSMDESMKVGAEQALQKLNVAYNRMSIPRLAFSKKLDTIFRGSKNIDRQLTDGRNIIKAIETGNLEGLSPDSLQAANKFTEYFSDGLEFVNRLVREKDPNIIPLSIPRRPNYVPHMLVDSSEMTNRVRQRVEGLEKAVGKRMQDWTSSELKIVTSDGAGKELLQALALFDVKVPSTGPSMSSAIKDAFESRSGRIRLDTEAKAALERDGKIPDFLRELDLFKLAKKWTDNTLRHLYLRDGINELGSTTRVLKAAGAELEASYLTNLLQDLNGVRKGTAAEYSRLLVTEWHEKLDKLTRNSSSPPVRAALAVAKSIPEIINDIGRNIYPNMLGFSGKAVLQNLTQPYLKTAPELGAKYGPVVLLRGVAALLQDLPGQIRKVEQLGLAPAEFTSKYNRAVAEGIQRSALYSIPSQVLQQLGDLSMALYTKTDSLNRAITLSVAEVMTQDLLKGGKLAKSLATSSLASFPTSVKRAAATATSEQDMARIIAEHLNSSTQYNYNRISMSEFGRTWGPVFSIFSKWPTATAGEILSDLRSKGALRGSLRTGEKYLVPFLLLAGVDQILSGGEGPKEGFSDRQKKLLGGTGLKQAAPLGSIEGILKGDFFTPPAVDLLNQGLIQPALKGDPAGLQKGAGTAIQQFMPGAVWVRFLTDDLVTYLSGRRPEGSDFIERTQSGLDELRK